MAKYRRSLPQIGGGFFITEGGLETTLIFLEGRELPHFAVYHLLESDDGARLLRRYFRTYAELATRFGTGLVLETVTWRANRDWGDKLGLAEANRSAVRLVESIRTEYETAATPIVISGCIGPRGDGYVPDRAMSAGASEDYHRVQIETFAGTAADLVTAHTMNDVAEAVGLVRAAEAAAMPVVISFTVETDGRLPTGQPLGAAIQQVDDATSGYPAYFMLNCAHPSHFDRVLDVGAPWVARIRGLRANASRLSHAELNEATELDAGVPAELGHTYAGLKRRHLPHLNVMGGCCGTDHRHVEQIVAACLPLYGRSPDDVRRARCLVAVAAPAPMSWRPIRPWTGSSLDAVASHRRPS